jgi:hypothetical protein
VANGHTSKSQPSDPKKLGRGLSGPSGFMAWSPRSKVALRWLLLPSGIVGQLESPGPWSGNQEPHVRSLSWLADWPKGRPEEDKDGKDGKEGPPLL